MIDALSAWWAEWSSYRPSDFLMFSPRIYWRLFESLNRAAWPVQGLLIGAPLVWLSGLAGRWHRVGEGLALRAAALYLGVGWSVVAWYFLAERYAPINWPARGAAIAFAVQAMAWLPLMAAGRLRLTPATTRRRIGIGLLVWALLGHPALAPIAGRPWLQAEVIGLAPDPTVIASLGVLLLLDAPGGAARRWLRLLWWLPVAWCVAAAALATMGSPQAGVMLAAGLLAVAAACWPQRRGAHADRPAHRTGAAPNPASAGPKPPPR